MTVRFLAIVLALVFIGLSKGQGKNFEEILI